MKNAGYAFTIASDGDGFLLTFPDVPEAITGGASEAEAIANAQEALDLALASYAVVGESLPVPRTAPDEPAHSATPSAAIMAKIAFIQAFRASGLTRTALAARLDKSEVEIRRMLNPAHATKLSNLEAGLMALGKRYVIAVEEMA